MCGNDYIGVEQLREKAKEFIANAGNAEHMPEKTQKNVEFFGTTLVNVSSSDEVCPCVPLACGFLLIPPGSAPLLQTPGERNAQQN